MKKLRYIFLGLLLFPFTTNAQVLEAGDIFKIWSNPVIYNYDEKVSWYFDLTGTTFNENDDVYIWIWSPSEPDAGNWNNSSEFAKLTNLGNMVWRFDLTPTTYFKRTPAEIKASTGFWLRLKDKTGTKQSSVGQIAVTDFSAFATSGKVIDFYPQKFYLNQPLSIIFNSNLVPGFAGATGVYMHSGLNNWDLQQQYQAWLPDVVTKVQLVDMGGGIYRKDLVPAEYYSTPDGYVMNVLNFLFVKDNWAATTPDFILYAPNVPIPPDPVLTFFPIKISLKDILVITRLHNTAGQKVSYSIQGGTKTITGTFTGGMDTQSAYISLVSSFAGMDISKLSVTLTDQKNKILFQGDLPLVKLD
jgi:hypothetical protein